MPLVKNHQSSFCFLSIWSVDLIANNFGRPGDHAVQPKMWIIWNDVRCDLLRIVVNSKDLADRTDCMFDLQGALLRLQIEPMRARANSSAPRGLPSGNTASSELVICVVGRSPLGAYTSRPSMRSVSCLEPYSQRQTVILEYEILIA